MAELIVEPIQTAELESSGYVGQPEGNIDLTENNVQVNVAPYKYATPKIPIQAAPDPESLQPVAAGIDSGGVYISDDASDNTLILYGRDATGIYGKEVIT